MDNITIISNQLSRMRQMNRYYHQQFLFDVRFLFLISIALLIFPVEQTFFIIPFVSLFGAVLLSFHAHYLIFSRNFSQYLEKEINKLTNKKIMIAHELENTYFFPIQDKKIVVAGFGKSFSWFGFVTLFITLYGVGYFMYGVVNINFEDSVIYTVLLITLSAVTLLTGFWWFVLGVGEDRLKAIYEK